MYICNSCSKTLCQTSVENPIVPVHMKDKIIRAGDLFLKALNDRPEFVCTCCHRMLFRKTVRKFKEHDYDFTNDVVRKSLSYRFILKVKQLMNHNVVLGAINSIEELSNKLTDSAEIVFDEYICIRCRNALRSKRPRMPDQACANDLKLFTIPDELKNLFTIERRLISLQIPFITLIVMRKYGGHYKINGPPVNVPATLDQKVEILPRMLNDLQLHPLKLRRKLEYKGYYMYDVVRKDKILGALAWLKGNNRYYARVEIDGQLLDNLPSDCLDQLEVGVEDSVLPPAEMSAKKDCIVMGGGTNNCEEKESNGNKNAMMQKSSAVVHNCANDNNVDDSELIGRNPPVSNTVIYENNATHQSQDVGELESTNPINEKPIDSDKDETEDNELAEDQRALDNSQQITGEALPSVVQYDNLENVIYNCAPGENNIPKYILLDDDFEVLAFPDLFPSGEGAYNSHTERVRDLHIRKYFQQRLLNVDGRFAKNIEYIFCAQYISDIKQIQGDANLAIRLSRGCTLDGRTVTAGTLRDPNALQQLVRSEQAYKFLKNVRGSPAYWQNELYDVLSMLQKLGIPTWFLTLSAADLHWPEMIQAIASQYGQWISRANVLNMDISDRSKYLRQNPVTGVRMFQHRLESFFTTYLLSDAHPIGHIIDYVIKIEFQMRGSPHAHCLLWVKNAPKIDDSDDTTVINFIDKYITAALPEDNYRNEHMRGLVSKLQ